MLLRTSTGSSAERRLRDGLGSHGRIMLGSWAESSLHCDWSFHLFLEAQSSWQVQHLVNLHAQIAWQAQHFVNLHAQSSWQAQHFVNLHAAPNPAGKAQRNDGCETVSGHGRMMLGSCSDHGRNRPSIVIRVFTCFLKCRVRGRHSTL